MNAILPLAPAGPLATVRALIPACATLPTPAHVADAIDQARDDLWEHDAVQAVFDRVLATHAAVDVLSDLVWAGEQRCGDEPECGQRIGVAPGGGWCMDDYGDEAAWQRWTDDVADARADADREFRSCMAAMLRDVERVLAGRVVGECVG